MNHINVVDISITGVFDPNIPAFPVVQISKRLPEEIRVAIEKHLDFLHQQKNAPCLPLIDLYALIVSYFERIKPIFSDETLIPIWNNLYKKSPEATLTLVHKLLKIENDYEHAMKLQYKHREEIKHGKKMLREAKKISQTMTEHITNFYGHMLPDNSEKMLETLSEFIRDSRIRHANFKEHIKSDEYLFSDYWPISRKHKTEKALMIFFIRKIYHHFYTTFGSPMCRYIAEIIRAIFGAYYSDNEIIKFCNAMKFPSDDSLIK